jgi:hypothetical protein
MAQGSRPPANARDMHGRLQELGVVDRVNQILIARDGTHSISNLLCWAAVDRGQLVVKAAYRHQRAGLTSGKPEGRPMDDGASFAVTAGKAFGPIGSESLSTTTIAAIRDLAA